MATATTMNSPKRRAVRAVRHSQLHAVSGVAGARRRVVRLGRPRATAISTSFPAGAATCWAIVPPPVVEAVQEQVATLIHVPNTWYTEAQGRWAKLLSRAELRRAGVLLQLGHRGQRGGHQARPAAHAQEAATRSSRSRRLPRPHARRHDGHGPAQVSRGPRPADGRLRLRPVRRPGRRRRS